MYWGWGSGCNGDRNLMNMKHLKYMKMPHQSIIYLLISIFVVIFAHYVHLMVVYLDIMYTYTHLKLAPLFSNNEAGMLFRGVILLTLFPIGITAIPALIYRVYKGHTMPYYFSITWIVWLVIVVSKIIIL